MLKAWKSTENNKYIHLALETIDSKLTRTHRMRHCKTNPTPTVSPTQAIGPLFTLPLFQASKALWEAHCTTAGLFSSPTEANESFCIGWAKELVKHVYKHSTCLIICDDHIPPAFPMTPGILPLPQMSSSSSPVKATQLAHSLLHIHVFSAFCSTCILPSPAAAVQLLLPLRAKCN